jgi:O-antigen/teichoic acid export membrane protein
MPLLALGALRGAALQGLRRVVLGQLPEIVIRPGLFALFLLVVVNLNLSGFNAVQAMILNVAATAISFVVGTVILYSYRPAPLQSHPVPVYKIHTWLTAVWPMALAACINQLNKYTDIIMLGFFVSAESVGIYRVAVQGSMLVAFGLQAISLVLLPYFARLHESNSQKKMQTLCTLSTIVTFCISLAVVLFYIFFGDVIISKIFGTTYSQGYSALIILSIGQLINASFGAIAFLLIMCGHEKKVAFGLSVSALVNIPLNAVLIPVIGIEGAALSTVISILIRNLVLWHYAHKFLNIDCFVVPIKYIISRFNEKSDY